MSMGAPAAIGTAGAPAGRQSPPVQAERPCIGEPGFFEPPTVGHACALRRDVPDEPSVETAHAAIDPLAPSDGAYFDRPVEYLPK